MRIAEKTILKFDFSDLVQEEDPKGLFHWHFVLPYVCILCNVQEEQHCILRCSPKTRIRVGGD